MTVQQGAGRLAAIGVLVRRSILAPMAARLERGIKQWSWINLRIASGVQEGLRRRLTGAGQGVLAVTVTAGLFGLDTRQTAASQVFALGLALLLVAWGMRGRRPVRLVAQRLLPRHASVGVPCRYRVLVSNVGPDPLRGLAIGERLADPRPPRMAFLSGRAPFEGRLNALERLFGYPRWEALVRARRQVEPPLPVALPDLAPGASVAVELTLLPVVRGRLSLPALVATRTDVLNLTRREWLVAPSDGAAATEGVAGMRDRLVILPQRWPVPPQTPPGRRRLQPGGVTLAAAVGDSREFIGLRDYLPGDSPRHIHWAAWARCGEPVVKEYQDEYFSRLALVLDTCPGGTDVPRALLDARRARVECAVSVAASLVAPLLRAPGGQDALLELLLVAGVASGGGRQLRAGRGLATTDSLLEALAVVQPAPDDAWPVLADLVLRQAAGLSLCICVLLDWDAPRQRLIADLAARGLALRVLVCAEGTAALDAGPLFGAAQRLLRVDPQDPAPALLRL